MTYPRVWQASTDLSIESGTAIFKVEGVEYTLRLDNFEAFQAISDMLDGAFKSGKEFAAMAMRSHVERSLDDAERAHGLACASTSTRSKT